METKALQISRAPDKVLTLEEINRILDSVDNTRHLLFFEILKETGVRNTELRMLKFRDIETNRNEITFISLKTRRKKGEHRSRKKPWEMRREDYERMPKKTIPISHELSKHIKMYIKDHRRNYKSDDYFFVNKNNEPVSKQGLAGIVDHYAIKAGVQQTVNMHGGKVKNDGTRGYYRKLVTPHTFRHSLATLLMMKTSDINLTKEVLDHASIASTQKYIHYSMEVKKEKMKGLFDS